MCLVNSRGIELLGLSLVVFFVGGCGGRVQVDRDTRVMESRLRLLGTYALAFEHERGRLPSGPYEFWQYVMVEHTYPSLAHDRFSRAARDSRLQCHVIPPLFFVWSVGPNGTDEFVIEDGLVNVNDEIVLVVYGNIANASYGIIRKEGDIARFSMEKLESELGLERHTEHHWDDQLR